MNVKKGVSAPRKGQTSLPQTLAHVIFFHIFFTQASTPSLRGSAIGFTQRDRASDRVLVLLMVFIVKSNVLFLEEIYCVFSNEVEFRSMGYYFEHLRGNFGHLEDVFGSLGVES